MKTLLLDAGNTAIKWCLCCATDDMLDLQYVCHLESSPEQVVEKLLKDMQGTFDQIIMVSVLSSEFEQWLLTLCNRSSVSLKTVDVNDCSKRIDTHYEYPEHLGMDRWVAMLGARCSVDGDVVIIDCGTATTIDYLDANSKHRGGVIMPGYALMLDALAQKTVALSEVDEEPIRVFATSTRQGIHSGVMLSIVASIREVLNQMLQSGNLDEGAGISVFLTGGDAKRISPLLQVQHRLEPELILTGLQTFIQPDKI